MRFAVIFIALLCIFSCSKKQRGQTPTGLIGRWRLVESYSSPGGPGTWTAADPTHPSYVQFSDGGAVVFTPFNEYAATGYRVTSDSTMMMFRTADSLLIRYTLSPTELVLMAPCIEGCADRYVPDNLLPD